ncbi:amidohydrolase family protein [Elongatibacter sediminis]|uniref:Amidohydrolase family protein n=1 Tax=Elongatibacter sediminis TaxID=3119006 RepID=A0AAW9R541_9GAMM
MNFTLRAILVGFVGGCLAGPLAADDLVISGARVFTATGPVAREGLNVVIRDDRIAAVSTDVEPPEDAVVIDGRGYTVLPGLIDPHVHLFFDLTGDGPAFPTSDADAEAFLMREMPADLEDYLDHGFTTLLAAIDFWPHILKVRARLESGELRGPRLLAAGGVLMAPGWHYICGRLKGEPKQWCNDHVAVQIDSPSSAVAAVQRYAASGVDAIVYDSMTNASGVDPAVVTAVVDTARASGLPVLVHNSDTAGYAALMDAGVDGFLHPPAGTLDTTTGEWRVISGAVPEGLVLGITIGETEEAIRNGQRSPEQQAAFSWTRKNVQYLLANGALPVYASDIPGAAPDYTMPIVIRSLTDLGLTPAEVLQAATIHAAAALGQADEIGSLEAGKRADVLVVRGDPTRDPAALGEVVLVIQNGEIVVDNRP